jgi:hypothetical protein
LWNDRLTFEATWYQKLTKNALVSPALPPSFGNQLYTTNLGRVSNHGVELMLTAQPIVSAPVTWNVTLTYSANGNKLVKGTDGSFFGVGFAGLQQRYVDGYPLAGYWDRPILAYADVNGDGIIEPSEIKLGDSAVFLGAPYPKADISVHQTLAFLSGRLSLGVGLDIRDRFTQFNMVPTTAVFYSRGITDPSASLAEQVTAQEALFTNFFFLGAGTSEPFVQTISWLRLSELSLTYTLPARVATALRARDASLSLMGRNLGLWTKYRGVDPEINTEASAQSPEVVDDGGVPQPREWRVRLNLGF